MLSAHRIKILQSLDKKKFRQKYNLFLVEGNKTIRELKNSRYKVKEIYTVNPEDCDFPESSNIIQISGAELKKISLLKHPKDSVAICEIPEPIKRLETRQILVLDGIQDPGNFGTIIRLADWFGIEEIVCSEDTVDLYNPKTIQASMGSFCRVNVLCRHLSEFLSTLEMPILGADLEGENIYQFQFPEHYALVLGNEGQGLRPEIKSLLNSKISIPQFGKYQKTESLNVSMATGIILGEIFSTK